jgi:hypothetical protein
MKRSAAALRASSGAKRPGPARRQERQQVLSARAGLVVEWVSVVGDRRRRRLGSARQEGQLPLLDASHPVRPPPGAGPRWQDDVVVPVDGPAAAFRAWLAGCCRRSCRVLFGCRSPLRGRTRLAPRCRDDDPGPPRSLSLSFPSTPSTQGTKSMSSSSAVVVATGSAQPSSSSSKKIAKRKVEDTGSDSEAGGSAKGKRNRVRPSLYEIGRPED